MVSFPTILFAIGFVLAFGSILFYWNDLTVKHQLPPILILIEIIAGGLMAIAAYLAQRK